MKSRILPLAVISILTLYQSPALAQVSPQYGGATMGLFGMRQVGQPIYGVQTSGLFGNRIIGQPPAPYRSGFASGNQLGPVATYMYLGQPSIYQIGVLPQALPPGYNLPATYSPASNQPQTSVSVTSPAPANAPTNNLPQTPVEGMNQAMPEGAPAFLQQTNANAMQGAGPAGQGLGPTPAGIQSPVTANFVAPRGQVRVTSTANIPARAFNRSSKLSTLLTQIANSRGMSTGGINVYLDNNNVALVEGAVRSPGDSFLLTNILGLEPGVRQVDNRLIVEGSSTPASR
jgi:hypothetical protein